MVSILKRVLAGLAMCALSTWASADEAAARKLVEDFHAVLAQVMRTERYADREARLADPISAAFDSRRIATISLGRTWRTLPDDQRAAFVALLVDLITATYADRFDSDSGQSFVTDEVTPVKTGFVVRTRLVRPSEEDVSLDYFLRDGKIFNVVADGVSDLSLRRADYNSIIKNEGYDALLVHIRDKIKVARGQE